MTGEVVRALWLKSNGGSGTFGAGVFLFEKIADIIVLLMFSFICYFFFFYTAGESLDIFIYCGFFLVGVFGLVLNSHRFSFLFDFAAQLAQRSLFTQKHLLKRVLALKQALITELNAEQRLVVLALTIMIWGGLALGMSYAMNLLGTLNHWTQGGGLLVAANFAGFISPLPANIGTYQFAGSNILSLYGVQLTDAICVTIILHFVMLFQVCFVGLITFWLYGGSLKTISNEGEV